MHPITTQCRVLGVSASGYYAWAVRPASARATADAALMEQIPVIHTRSRGTYGERRVHAELAALGVHIGRKRVARLMRALGLAGVSRRKGTRTTIRDRDARPAPDLVDRDFTAAAPDRLWVADITYVPTWAGFLYLAVVLDAWSRRVVGWAMATHLRTALVLEALNMALAQRRPTEVIHHSDQGCQGGFDWSSQRLDYEELRWENRNGDGPISRGEHRCARLVDRQWHGVRNGSDSGQRSPMVCRVRRRAWLLGCRQRWVSVGSARVAACQRSVGLRSRGVTYHSPSARRSRS